MQKKNNFIFNFIYNFIKYFKNNNFIIIICNYLHQFKTNKNTNFIIIFLT